MISKKKLGEILTDSGLLTEEQLENALADHKKTPLKLGQYIALQGIVSELQIVDVLCEQLKIERYHPDKYPLGPDLVNVIPVNAAKKYLIAPLLKKGRLLTIAMIDPLDINAMDYIETLTNCEVEPVICTDMELTNLHSSIYTTQSGLEDIIESIEDDEEVAFEKADEHVEEIEIETAQNMLDAPAVMRLVNSIFAGAIQEKASDIHISPKQDSVQLRFRIDGKLRNMPAPPKSMHLAMVGRIKILADMDITQSRTPLDGRLTLKMGHKVINVRVSTVPSLYGENLVLRLLDSSTDILTLDRLGMSDFDVQKIRNVIHKPYGMVLSTGPTGSGKTSSLYAILQEINEPDIHIITLEDPVEYKIDSICQIQMNEKAGMNFANGLRAVLRQDPDVIMVGEIRDTETAAIAIRAAQTGHRLLSTMHTNNAAGAVAQLVQLGIEPFLVSSALLVSFAQRLIRTVCPYCKEQYMPPAGALVSWRLDKVKAPVFLRGKGCQQCMNTGYKGRTGIFEVLVTDDVIKEMILKNASAKEITHEAVSAGNMRTLQQDAADKVVRGLTTLEEAEATVMA